MAKTYEQLQHQIAKLQAEAEKLRRSELEGVIERIRGAIDHYGLTAADLGLTVRARAAAPKAKPATRRKATRKAAAKAASGVLYRNEQGQSWVGRGKRPQWLRDALNAGRKLEDFRVAEAT